eukprot:SAG31_NODE_2875_length_4971_cov_2.727011_2_plen_98_part_00
MCSLALVGIIERVWALPGTANLRTRGHVIHLLRLVQQEVTRDSSLRKRVCQLCKITLEQRMLKPPARFRSCLRMVCSSNLQWLRLKYTRFVAEKNAF